MQIVTKPDTRWIYWATGLKPKEFSLRYKGYKKVLSSASSSMPSFVYYCLISYFIMFKVIRAILFDTWDWRAQYIIKYYLACHCFVNG